LAGPSAGGAAAAPRTAALLSAWRGIAEPLLALSGIRATS